MNVFVIILPVITLVLGFSLDLIARLFTEKAAARREFYKNRYHLVLFPMYIEVLDYSKRNVSIDTHEPQSYLPFKMERIDKILRENSIYVSSEMVELYTMFVAEFYDRKDLGRPQVWDEYEALCDCVINEYSESEQKVLLSKSRANRRKQNSNKKCND